MQDKNLLSDATGQAVVADGRAMASSRAELAGLGMDALKALKSEMDDIEDVIEDVKCFVNAQSAKELDKLVRNLRSFTPSVTLLGQIKSGKTCLVNAMVGQPDLLPSDVNPWTSVVTSLHLNSALSGRPKAASFQMFERDEWDYLVKHGGRLGELSSRAGATDEEARVRAQIAEMREKTMERLGRRFELLLGQKHEYDELTDDLLARYICMGDDFDDGSEQAVEGQFADLTKSADLYLDAPAIPLPMCVRDTPGVNDTFMMREQVTINALRESRVCVVVLSASQALTSVDMGLIRLISNMRSREIVIFVNRIDELPDPGADVRAIEQSIKQTLVECNGPTDVEILFGSAHWARLVLQHDESSLEGRAQRALESFAGFRGVGSGTLTSSDVWELSGVPSLYESIGQRVQFSEAQKAFNSVRRRARNYALGLKASSSVVSVRLAGNELEMMSPDDVFAKMAEIEAEAERELLSRLNRLFEGYQARIDQAHRRYVDRALDALIKHLETFGEEAPWQYSPEGLRVLLRSSYQMMRSRAARSFDEVLAVSAMKISQVYRNLLNVEVEGFEMQPPQTPSFPPPVALGQTIALDLKGAFWKSWWQRRKGYGAHADNLRSLIEAETEAMITDIKVGQIERIRELTMASLRDFIADQTGILTEVTQKSQVSTEELNELYGVIEQEEREEMFDLLIEEFSLGSVGVEDDEHNNASRDASDTDRHSRPQRPLRKPVSADFVDVSRRSA